MAIGPILGASVGVLAAGGIGYGIWREKRDRNREAYRQTNATVRLLIPRSNFRYEPEEAVKWIRKFSNLARTLDDRHAKGAVSFVFRAIKPKEGAILFVLDSPRDRENGVKKTLLPDVEWLEDEKNVVPTTEGLTATKLVLEDKALPIAEVGREDYLPNILRAMSEGSELRVEFSPLFEKDAFRHVQNAHKTYDPERFESGEGDGGSLLGDLSGAISQIGRDMGESLGKDFGFAAKGSRSVGSPKPVAPKKRLPHEDARAKSVIQRYHYTREMFTVTMTYFTTEEEKRVAVPTLLAALSDVEGNNRFRAGKGSMVLSASELAQLVHVTNETGTLTVREHAKTLHREQLSEGIGIGYLQHPTQGNRLVRIPYSNLSRHWVLSGKTGSGKSSTLVFAIQSILEDFVAQKPGAPGFTFVDPAEETVLILLSRLQQMIPPDHELWHKIHYISFGNYDAPVPMNFLQVLSRDAVLELLTKDYGGGASLDELIDKAVGALQSVPEERHVLAGMMPLFKEESWRLRISRKIEDPLLRQYWEQTFPQTVKPAAVAPVERRLNPFVRGFPALFFAQPDYALPIRQWMDEGHIVLLDVKPLGERLMDLIVGTIIERYYRLSMTRTPNTSRLHLLLIDECHRVQVSAMKGIIKEARKFGLSLGMITQSVHQFQGDLQQEIFDNVGTVLSNRQGPDAARVIQRLTSGAFAAQYLETLPPLVTAVYTDVNGEFLSVETKGDFPRLSKAPYPNREFIQKPNSPEQEERILELREFGATLQRKLSPKNPKEVQAEFLRYLKTGSWKPSRIEIPEQKEDSPARRKPTASDLL